MVGMDMRVQCHHQPQAKLGHQCHVAPGLFEDRIDQDAFAAVRAAEQIGVGGRLLIEKLAEYQHYASSRGDVDRSLIADSARSSTTGIWRSVLLSYS